MKQSVTIRIPEPCHEDWQKMTPTEKGKFCQVCTKEVVDFTAKTDEEIVKYVSKNNNACGRFKADQLNREVKLDRKSTASLAPYAASLLLPFSLLNGNEMQAQGQAKLSEKPLISLGIGSLQSTVSERGLIITTGIITNEKGQPLSYVEIIASESGKKTLTNQYGEFKITSMDRETLLIKKFGFDTKEIKRATRSENISVVLSEIKQTKEVAVITGKIKSITEEVENKENKFIKITGTVTDDTQLPLPGVNIIIKDTNIGTQTDFDGNYIIHTKPNQVLVFSYVGFDTQEITVSNISNTIDLELHPDNNILGQMIVGRMIGTLVTVHDRYGNIIEPMDTLLLNEENRAEWRNEIKEAYKNEIAFKKIKQARKKAARKLKRQNK